MQRGDIILKVNEIEVMDRAHLIDTVRSHLPGEKITLHVRRGEEEIAIVALNSNSGLTTDPRVSLHKSNFGLGL